MTSDSNAPTESSTSSKPWYRPEWDDIWIQMADVIAQRSKCDRAKTGAVIVDEDQNILAAAYNGPAPTWYVDSINTNNCTAWCPRAQGIGGTTSDYSNCPANHAEINALARMTPTTKKTRAYVNRLCCITCTKAMAAAGVSEVVCKLTDLDGHIDSSLVEEYFEACNILFWRYSGPAG
jgi:dCMP deaminase